MRRFLALTVFLGIIAIAAVAVQTTAQDGPPGGPGGNVPAARRPAMDRAAAVVRAAGSICFRPSSPRG